MDSAVHFGVDDSPTGCPLLITTAKSYPILVMARELVARGASDWTRRCHLLPAAYVASLCTQNTTRIPTALRTALGSQNEFYLHKVHLVTLPNGLLR